MADVDPTLGQKILDVAQRQRVSDVHHHDQTDDLWRAVEISERVAHGLKLARPHAGPEFALTEPAIGKLNDENAGVQSGINIVLRALEAPIRQIAENSGVEGSIVVGNVLANKSQSFGFDAQTEQYVDMFGAGIVDPAKVVRVALQDAASIAGLMITTEAMVAEAPKKNAAPAMPGGGGMGGMDY